MERVQEDGRSGDSRRVGRGSRAAFSPDDACLGQTKPHKLPAAPSLPKGAPSSPEGKARYRALLCAKHSAGMLQVLSLILTKPWEISDCHSAHFTD